MASARWFYGPHVANRLIAETLHPYAKGLVIASKLGGRRTPDKGWGLFCRPEQLREGCETDLRELRRDVLDDSRSLDPGRLKVGTRPPKSRPASRFQPLQLNRRRSAFGIPLAPAAERRYVGRSETGAMPSRSLAVRVVAASADQDRVQCKHAGDRYIIVLADGAGGMTGGRTAAERVVQHPFDSVHQPADCIHELVQLDRLLDGDAVSGETTAVVVVLLGERLFGASVGDSGVWMLTSEHIFDLTKSQHRKPLLGSGAARPVAFGPSYFNDRMLVASDGLLKYAPRAAIRAAWFERDIEAAADALVASARLPSGALQDDLSLVLIDPSLSP